MRRYYKKPPVDEHVRSHAAYDFDMEVLLMLPRLGNHQAYACHQDMVWDFRLRGQPKLVEALERLGGRFKIRTWATGCDGMGSALLSENWGAAQVVAQEYWEATHADSA